ncbi:MAG: ribosome assembly RNA-binding protein YhbY [Desulfomonilia bacterium]|nr:ribosome assembly RNA-binding protein YhbY [Desulfomonilia bacterium]
MTPLTGSQRKYLRGQAHALEPVVRIGKQGITESVRKSVNEALDARELIKVKFIDFKEEKADLSRRIAQETSAELVGLIGNIAILYRENPDRDMRKILLPAPS